MMTERAGPGSALGARPPSGLGAPGSRAPQSSSGSGSPARPGTTSVTSNPRPAMASRPTHSSNGSVPVSRPVSSTGPRPPSSGSGTPNNRPSGYHGGPEDNDKGLKMKIKRTKSGRQEIVSVSKYCNTDFNHSVLSGNVRSSLKCQKFDISGWKRTWGAIWWWGVLWFLLLPCSETSISTWRTPKDSHRAPEDPHRTTHPVRPVAWLCRSVQRCHGRTSTKKDEGEINICSASRKFF